MSPTRIDIVPATLDRLVQAILSQRGALRSGLCPADLRQLRLRQVVVAERMAGHLVRSEQAGAVSALPRGYPDWLDVPAPQRWLTAL
jgi:hypothetical protein